MSIENIGHVEVPRKFNTVEDVIAMYGNDIRKKVAEGMDIHEAAKTILEKDMRQYNDEDQEMVDRALEQLRTEIAPDAIPFVLDIDVNPVNPQTGSIASNDEELPPPPPEENTVI